MLSKRLERLGNSGPSQDFTLELAAGCNCFQSPDKGGTLHRDSITDPQSWKPPYELACPSFSNSEEIFYRVPVQVTRLEAAEFG